MDKLLEFGSKFVATISEEKRNNFEISKRQLDHQNRVLGAQIKFVKWMWIFIGSLIGAFVLIAGGLIFLLGETDKGLNIITGLAIGVAGVVLGYGAKVGQKD